MPGVFFIDRNQIPEHEVRYSLLLIRRLFHHSSEIVDILLLDRCLQRNWVRWVGSRSVYEPIRNVTTEFCHIMDCLRVELLKLLVL